MTDVTQAAQAGYRGDTEQRPAYLSSPNGLAYIAGMQHRLNGGQFPEKARMGRGCAVHVGSRLYQERDCQDARLTIIGSMRAEAASREAH